MKLGIINGWDEGSFVWEPDFFNAIYERKTDRKASIPVTR